MRILPGVLLAVVSLVPQTIARDVLGLATRASRSPGITRGVNLGGRRITEKKRVDEQNRLPKSILLMIWSQDNTVAVRRRSGGRVESVCCARQKEIALDSEISLVVSVSLTVGMVA